MTVIVAGSVVLDLIPALPVDDAGFTYRPGVVIRTGPARLSTGGCVSNTGGALYKLGESVRLIGKIGDDPFGHIVQEKLAGVGEQFLLVAPDEATGHSFVLSPPGHDRMIINHPGANNTFGADDIPADSLRDAAIFHFGYPSAMLHMYEENGRYLLELLQRAKDAGLVTSLDMSYPDPASPAGKANWPQILAAVLPLTDVFMPSLAEAVLMMKPADAPRPAKGKDPDEEHASAELISFLGQRFIDLGAAIAIIKVGERGIYLRTASSERLVPLADKLSIDIDQWAGRELWSNIFAANVVGTNGAGDSSAAGLLLGLARGMAPEDTITAGCAVGGFSVEAADSISAVVSWEQTQQRIANGWQRIVTSPGENWSPASQQGIWRSSLDSGY